jgi:hypothetical protein
VRVTLTYALMSKDQQLRVLAQGRVVQHIAYAVGAGAAAYVLATRSTTVFIAAVLLNAATFFVTALLVLVLPKVPAVPQDRQRASTQAIRDVRFVSVMATTAVLALCWAMLSSGLPLWVQNDTSAPVWTSAFAVVLSSASIAVFQVRVTKQGSEVPGAVRAARISALAIAVCCVLFAISAWPTSPVLALVVITAGIVAHVTGELHYVGARWGLSLNLMAKDAEGQYQGVAATTEAAVVALGPAAVTLLVTGLHGGGWLVLGLVVLVTAAPTKRLATLAMRDRPTFQTEPSSAP